MGGTSIIYDNVEIGNNVIIEDFCIIGSPPRNKKSGELKTVIGDNSIIRSHTVIYAGNVIGSDFQTGHQVVIRECNKIGNNVSIGTQSCIEHHIEIEDEVRIHSQVFIPEFSVLKRKAWIGPNVVITNAKYPRSIDVKSTLKGALIDENAKIGANCTLLPGVEIGRNALVGAGSLVSRTIAENSVAYGHPAVSKGNINEYTNYEKENG